MQSFDSARRFNQNQLFAMLLNAAIKRYTLIGITIHGQSHHS